MRIDVFLLLGAATVLCGVCADPPPAKSKRQVDLSITACYMRVAPDRSCLDNNDVNLKLYTRLNPEAGQVLDISIDNLSTTHLNASHPTKIIIHGWNDSGDSQWIVNITKAYLSRGEYNILAADWRVLTAGGFNCYPVSVSNARHAGKCLALAVGRLTRERGIADVHLVGFSLGAQVAAYVADHLKPYTLPRITGLDPALPMYYNGRRNARLDAGDALFVDVLHTNAMVQGQAARCGHVDFYVNGGTHQPGCAAQLTAAPYCSHHRSLQYYIESINSRDGFWGTPCRGYLSFMAGRCPVQSPAVLMGEHADHRSRGFVHVVTRAEPPYALGRWQFFHSEPQQLLSVE